MNELRYELPHGMGCLSVSAAVLEHMQSYKQLKWTSREAGGQLFATNQDGLVMVTSVTGPRPTDKRSIFNYEPDRAAERVEIKEHYERGLHFVGDWHTHKQKIPKPSGTDLRNIRALVRESKHDLAGFLLVVVGTDPFPTGLHISFHTRSVSTVLEAIIDGEPI